MKLIAFNHLLNAFCPTILMFVLFFFGYNSQAVDFGLLLSLTLLVTQIFSSNKRNLIISSKNIKLLISTVYFRLIFGIIIFVSIYFLIRKFNLDTTINLFFVFFCIMLWINELYLTLYELRNNKKNLIMNSYLFLIFLILIVIIILNKKIILIPYLFTLFFIILFFSYINKKILKKKKIINIFKVDLIFFSIKKNIIDLSFLSSFSFLLSVFIWRLTILNFFEDYEAVVYFICFALASFPATFLNNSVGITFVKEKIPIIDYKYYFIIYLLAAYIFIYVKTIYNPSINLLYHFEILTYSLFGIVFMVFGIMKRINILNKKKLRPILFKADFIYGLIISLIVPFLGFIGLIEYIKFSYFISAIITFVYYYVLSKNFV